METRDSCIFYADWLRGIETIPDKSVRCQLYESILHYALYGEEPDLQPEYIPMMTIIKMGLDRANGKREHVIEVKKKAARARWEKHNDAKDADNADVDCAMQKMQMQNVQCNNVYVNDNVNGYVNVNDNVDSSSSSSISNKNLKNLNTPLPPQGGVGGGKKGFVIYLSRVAAVMEKIPQRVSKCNYTGQYAWRIAEGMPAFAKAVDGLILSEKEDCGFELAFSKLLEKYKPQAEWQAFKVAEAAMGLDAHAVEALCAEIDRSRAQGEEGLWATMLDKIAYMKENEVKVPEAFLKKREHPVKYTKQQRKT